MKEIHEIRESLLYTKEHEWAKQESGIVVVGITDYAAKTLGDVVYLSLPVVGSDIKQLATFGTVESIKAVSELYSPVSGKVASVNDELANHPELVNQSPYDDGWIIKITPSNLVEELGRLLSSKQYAEFLTSLEP